MKRQLLTTVMVLLCIIAEAQLTNTKGFISTVYCVDDCYLSIQKTIENPITEDYILQFEADGITLKINTEFKDLTRPSPNPDYSELNPKYSQMKVKVIYSTRGSEKVLERLEYDTLVPVTIKERAKIDFTDSFPKASCKIFNHDGELEGFVENDIYYKVYASGKKNSGKSVQNKNEYCQGPKCIRITTNAQGYIVKYFLPNVAEGLVWGKVVGNKMWFCKKPDGSDINDALYFTYTGDRQQAVNLITMYDWFR
jgi:hypothetical protein